jgi:hypothetical protein
MTFDENDTFIKQFEHPRQTVFVVRKTRLDYVLSCGVHVIDTHQFYSDIDAITYYKVYIRGFENLRPTLEIDL